MGRNKKYFSAFQLGSAIFMVVALLWLTVSAPFVVEAKQKLAEKAQQTLALTMAADEDAAADSDDSNPFSNTTEEKAPSSPTSLSEEYLHDAHAHYCFVETSMPMYGSTDAATYTAFHGELLVPPPNRA